MAHAMKMDVQWVALVATSKVNSLPESAMQMAQPAQYPLTF
jgi:hypothetical protein